MTDQPYSYRTTVRITTCVRQPHEEAAAYCFSCPLSSPCLAFVCCFKQPVPTTLPLSRIPPYMLQPMRSYATQPRRIGSHDNELTYMIPCHDVMSVYMIPCHDAMAVYIDYASSS